MLDKTRKPFRWMAFGLYWSWLTSELLVSDPWVILSEKLAEDPPVDTHNEIISYAIHFGAFGVLGFLLAWALQRSTRRAVWIAVSLLYFYCPVTEVLQFWVPKRWPSVGDALADMFGIALGLLAYSRFVSHTRLVPPKGQAALEKTPHVSPKAA